MQDFRYTNPPLVEVVVEVHWAITKLQSTPGAAVDPHFEIFAPTVASQLKDAGYAIEENLRPPQIPIEFFANVVTTRYRRAPHSWPVIQVGPGVLTVNIVPPYDGWRSFREFVGQGLALLFNSYPLAERYLKISSVQLRYIDAFGTEHGFTGQFGSFLKENLRIGLTLPEEVLTSAQSADDLSALLELRIPLKNPPGATGTIKLAPGIAQNQAALVAEFSVITGDAPGRPEAMLSWLDEAHTVVRRWFDSMPRPKLLETFGEKVPV